MDERKQNVTKTVTKIITYLLFAVLILGLLGGIMYLLNSPSGLYVVYGEENITSENSGITVEWNAEESEVSFTIQNTEDWGAYTVKDCTVKVIPNVSTERDFEFTVDGGTALYSQEDDLTAAFVEDYADYGGNGLTVSEDGVFSLYLIAYTTDYLSTAMPELLSRVYGGSSVTISSGIDILDYAYFALQVTSPDGKTVISVAFRLSFNSSAFVYSINYDLNGVVANSDNAETIEFGESIELSFTAEDGYTLPQEVTVTNVGSYSWDYYSDYGGTLEISNPTGDVTITINGVEEETYTLSGKWLFTDTFITTETGTSGTYICSFTCNGESYEKIIVAWGYNCAQVAYGGSVVCTQSGGWLDEVYRVIDFGDEQSVSEVTYNFITTYATNEFYTVSLAVSSDTDMDYITVSPMVSDSVIGYITADGSITITISCDDEHYINYVRVTNATIYTTDGEEIGTVTGVIQSTSYTFKIANPTDDVITLVLVIDQD